MVGEGFMITYGPEKTIASVMKCKDGHPIGNVTLEQPPVEEPQKSQEQARGAGTGGHESESKEKAQSGEA